MTVRFTFFPVLVAVSSLLIQHSWSKTKTAPNSGPIASAERKLQHLQSNGEQARPDPAPTEFTEQEINAYFASGNVKLPAGVQSVAFQEQPEVVIGTSRVDFDQLK